MPCPPTFHDEGVEEHSLYGRNECGFVGSFNFNLSYIEKVGTLLENGVDQNYIFCGNEAL